MAAAFTIGPDSIADGETLAAATAALAAVVALDLRLGSLAPNGPAYAESEVGEHLLTAYLAIRKAGDALGLPHA